MSLSLCNVCIGGVVRNVNAMVLGGELALVDAN